MKIFTVDQIRKLDAYTISNEPVTSIELMERASRTFVKWFTRHFSDTGLRIHVFCGPGNNGGDGLAIARMLSREFYNITAWILQISRHTSDDFQTNLKNLKKHRSHIYDIHEGDQFPDIPETDIIIDAIFGSGLNKPVTGYWADLISHLNNQKARRVSVDIPSGMYADKFSDGPGIRADYTLSFELPKLGFFFPENHERVGEWFIESIGLSETYIQEESTDWHFVDLQFVKPLLRKRRKHEHKGSFGHALLITGGYGKVGAAVLASMGCMRSGAGLTTLHVPKCAYEILQTAVPEAMVSIDAHEHYFANIPDNLAKYDTVGIGCGLGTKAVSSEALERLLTATSNPMVIDADALNLLAERPSLLSRIPHHSILTPHPKEFSSLFGKTGNSFERMELILQKAKEYHIFIVLKGAYTLTVTPEGTCYFNGSGNPGLATGGSGDVLTGVITGLLAQGYSPQDAALLGVYLHGLAGDLAASIYGEEAMIASDINNYIGKAYAYLRNN